MALIGVCRKVADLADRVAAAHQHAPPMAPMRSRDTVITNEQTAAGEHLGLYQGCCVTSNLGPETVT